MRVSTDAAYAIKVKQITRLAHLRVDTVAMRPAERAALYEEIELLRNELKRLHTGNHELCKRLRFDRGGANL